MIYSDFIHQVIFKKYNLNKLYIYLKNIHTNELLLFLLLLLIIYLLQLLQNCSVCLSLEGVEVCKHHTCVKFNLYALARCVLYIGAACVCVYSLTADMFDLADWICFLLIIFFFAIKWKEMDGWRDKESECLGNRLIERWTVMGMDGQMAG